jgi:hypothetical protein
VSSHQVLRYCLTFFLDKRIMYASILYASYYWYYMPPCHWLLLDFFYFPISLKVESFLTYPCTYDLLYAWLMFSEKENHGCSVKDLLTEMDNVMRHHGYAIIIYKRKSCYHWVYHEAFTGDVMKESSSWEKFYRIRLSCSRHKTLIVPSFHRNPLFIGCFWSSFFKI